MADKSPQDTPHDANEKSEKAVKRDETTKDLDAPQGQTKTVKGGFHFDK